MLKVKNKIKVNIIGLDYKGDGISIVDDLYIFTPGLLKGEEATIELTRVKKKFAVGKVIKIHKKSIDRISNTSIFGSINLSHLSFLKQLKWQEDITKETMHKVLGNDINIKDIITDGKEYNYRNKVVFHAIYKPSLKLGLYSHNNKRLTAIDEFMLAPKIVNDIIFKLNKSNIIIKNKDIINISFKTNTKEEVLVTLVSSKKSFKELDEVVDFFKGFSNVKGITLNLKKHKEKILSNKSIILYGTNLLTEGILLMNDQSFMQVNYGVAELVYDLIKENIVGKTIVDAYSGVGSIGFKIYDEDYNITMIENNKENIKLANIIKENNNYKNIDIVMANAEDVIGDYMPDTIIVDPPRKGLNNELINAVINNNVKRVIYLSCDLQTQVRDLRVFVESYDILKVYPIKMFPQTSAFETLVILDKKD